MVPELKTEKGLEKEGGIKKDRKRIAIPILSQSVSYPFSIRFLSSCYPFPIPFLSVSYLYAIPSLFYPVKLPFLFYPLSVFIRSVLDVNCSRTKDLHSNTRISFHSKNNWFILCLYINILFSLNPPPLRESKLPGLEERADLA